MEEYENEDIEMIYSGIEKELFMEEENELKDDGIEPGEEAFMRGYEEDY